MALALISVAWLLFFIHHTSHAISVSHIVDRIASETGAVIRDVMPNPRRQPRGAGLPVAFDPDDWRTAILSETSGYIRFIDAQRHELVPMRRRLEALEKIAAGSGLGG
jgi:uncharacterized membrane protein